MGEAGGADVGELSNGQCVFRGGRSARLTCRNELDGTPSKLIRNGSI